MVGLAALFFANIVYLMAAVVVWKSIDVHASLYWSLIVAMYTGAVCTIF